MLVKNIMQEAVPITHPEHPAHEALEKMVDIGAHFLPVVDEHHRLIGMLSESDYVRACYPQIVSAWQFIFADEPSSQLTDVARLLAHLKVSDIMTRQVTTVTPQHKVEEVVHLLVGHRIHQVPVVDDEGHLLGVVTRRHIVKHLLRAFAPYVAQTTSPPTPEHPA